MVPSQTPSAAPTPACVLNLGMVYSGTGPRASNQAVAGITTAVNKINVGDWATGPQTPGFAFGNETGCTFNLIALDDQSDAVLHMQLVKQLLPQVDVLVGGTQFLPSAQPEVAAAFAAKKMQIKPVPRSRGHIAPRGGRTRGVER